MYVEGKMRASQRMGFEDPGQLEPASENEGTHQEGLSGNDRTEHTGDTVECLSERQSECGGLGRTQDGDITSSGDFENGHSGSTDECECDEHCCGRASSARKSVPTAPTSFYPP